LEVLGFNGRREDIKKKKNKGGGEPYTIRRPPSGFFLAFLLWPQSLPPSDTFHSLGAATPRRERAHHMGDIIVHSHLSSSPTKKKA